MRVSFYTLGCKLNQAETDELKEGFLALGFDIVPFGAEEDIAVIRACGVTCGASGRTRQIIRNAKRNGAYTLVTGCLEDKDLPEIDTIQKTNEEILAHVKACFELPEKNAEGENIVLQKTRGFVKIQNGCNFACSYCIIPHFRGKATSISKEEVLEKVKRAEEKGFQELVLTGVNVCQYLHEGINLARLLDYVVSNSKMPRFRLGSLDPRLISDELISVFEKHKERLLPHMHLSLQSGSNEVLKAMNRTYTAEKYLEIVKKCRAFHPEFSFTTDIIVGFPGETDEEFEESVEFVKKVEFAKVHVFPYSDRPGTEATKLGKKVDGKIKKERVAKLIQIADETAKQFEKKLHGQLRPVLIENKKGKFFEGYTPEYTRVEIDSDDDLTGKIVEIKIK